MSKVQSWNTITLFCILIFGFTAATLLKPASEYSETENRTLAQMPQISAETLLDGTFESDYETYLTDQFVMRDAWIGWKTLAERAAFRTESKEIYFAQDGYLIEKHTDSFTSQTAQQNLQILEQFAQKYQPVFGADHMSVMVVPNAVSVLADLLPPFAAPYDQRIYLDQVKEAVGDEVWFDAGTVLDVHSEEPLFYRTDHHWKTLAAFYVYQAWAEKMGYEVPQKEMYEVEVATDSFEGTIQSKLGIASQKDTIELYHRIGDPLYTVEKNNSAEITYSIYDRLALDTKSKYDVFFGGNQAVVKMKTQVKNGRKILVIKDSYAHCFVPFMLDGFEEITMLDIRYYNQKLSELIEQNAYTDFLFLYNASGFAEDTSIGRIMY